MSNPVNITANVGQVGGAPLTPADVSSYLTQLGGSLNGFAGSVSNVLNYLLAQNALGSRIVRIGALSANITPAYNGTLATLCGMAQNGTGTVITPVSAGRVISFAVATATMNFPQGTGVFTNIIVNLFLGSGTSGPAYGTTCSASTGPVGSAAFGPSGFAITCNQGNVSGGDGLQATGLLVGYRNGLTVGQPYWVDMTVHATGNATSAGTLLTPSYLILMEF